MRILAFFVFVCFTTAHGEMNSAFDLETAQTLPAGVSSPRFKLLLSRSADKFDSEGRAQPLGTSLNRDLTWGDIIKAQDSEADKASLQSLLNSGTVIPEDAAAGAIRAQVNSATTATVPIFLYGVTERFTLGVAVPVLNVDVKADTGFFKSESAQELIRRACEASSPVKCAEAARQLNDALQHRLKTLGYQPLASRQLTAMGDMRILGRYSLTKSEIQQLTLKPSLLLPTGQKADPDDVLEIRTGNGAVAVNLVAVYDRWEPLDVPNLKFTAYAGGGVTFAHRRQMRVPTLDSPLSADKEEIQRGATPYLNGGTSLGYRLGTSGFSLGVGYHYQYMGGVGHTGSQFEAARYQKLDTTYGSQQLHNATLLAGFSTVDWYRAKTFPVPFEAGFTFNRGLGGRNSSSGDLYAFESIFFL